MVPVSDGVPITALRQGITGDQEVAAVKAGVPINVESRNSPREQSSERLMELPIWRHS
jgi:hypothetical protein